MRRFFPILAAAVVLVFAGCSNENGELIAFMSDRDGDYEIFVMDADGTNVRQLTDDPDRSIERLTVTHQTKPVPEKFNHDYDGDPAWSPDGNRIAFQSDRDGDHEIFVMDADGTNVQQLTDNDSYDENPAWSPDGNRIVFVSDREQKPKEFFVMDADGTNVVTINQRGLSPVWR